MVSPIKLCLNCAKDMAGMEMLDRRKFCGNACAWASKRRPELLAPRFWAKVQKADGDACWTWLGARSSVSGYGTFNYQGHNINAHRAAWLIVNGPIEGKDIDVLHTCHHGDIGCVTPHHLYLGTHQQNMLDRLISGRDNKAMLTPAQVREIRVALTAPYHGIQCALARQYNVKLGVINDLKQGHTYGWVK